MAELIDAVEAFQVVSFPVSQLLKADSVNSALDLLKYRLLQE